MRDILKQLGKIIRNERKKKKLSQDELADRAGLHPTYIGGIERGERNPTVESLSKIADALQVPLYTLFLAFENDGQNNIPVSEMTELLQNLDEKSRNIILRVLQAMILEFRK